MVTYLGVTAVKAKGKPFHAVMGRNKHPGNQIPAGHLLVVILGNGLYEIAGNVTHPSEYEAAYQSHYNGAWTSFQLYTLSEALVAECPDEGRVPVMK